MNQTLAQRQAWAEAWPLGDLAVRGAMLWPDAEAIVVDDERRTFTGLNETYTQKFGFPFIIAVKDNTKASIMQAFRTRIDNDRATEFATACKQVERIAYLAEMASVQLSGYDALIVVDTKDPVSFSAYPGKKSYLVPDGCTPHHLVTPSQDAVRSLELLCESVGASHVAPRLQKAERPGLPTGDLTASKVCQAIGALLPDRAIICDEAQTSGLKLPVYTAGAPRHDVLTLTGGAIGQSLPLAVGAAIAGGDRPVLALVGDGSAMYTIQALWTMARENLDVTTVIFNNRSYAILNIELQRTGADKPGPEAKAQLDLSSPPLDFVAIAQGMGVPARRATTAEEFNDALARAFREPGPHLIEAVVPSEYQGLKLKALPHVLNALDAIPSGMAKAIKKKIAP